MDAQTSDNYSLRGVLTDAIRYWEKRRLPYNAVLVLAVLGNIALAWPQSRNLIQLPGFLLLFVLAVIANVCYSSAYLVDVMAQLSDFRSGWVRYRWMLWAVGTAFATVLAWYWMVDEVLGS